MHYRLFLSCRTNKCFYFDFRQSFKKLGHQALKILNQAFNANGFVSVQHFDFKQRYICQTVEKKTLRKGFFLEY